MAQNSTLQIERKGYFIVDRGYDASKPDAPMRLISIPDGRIASTSSKNATSGGNADVASPAAAAKAGKSAVTAAAPAKPIMYAMSPLHTGVVMTAPKDVCAMYTMTPLVDNLLSTIGGGAVSLKTATKPAAASTTAGGAAVAKADKKNEKKKDKAVAAVTLPVAEGPLVAKLDIVVGKIVEVAKVRRGGHVNLLIKMLIPKPTTNLSSIPMQTVFTLKRLIVEKQNLVPLSVDWSSLSRKRI